jgi:(p)ppGpp synthase/HD superfamily hydrolase
VPTSPASFEVSRAEVIRFVSDAYDGVATRSRKGLAHARAAADVLRSAGCSDLAQMVALLHDVVEDTPATVAEIRQAFGPRVALLVASVSEDPTLHGAERKQAYREQVRVAPRDAQAICAADKVCNVEDLRMSAASGDHLVLQRFHGGLHAQAQRFTAELRMLCEAGVDTHLTDALRRGVLALEAEARRLSIFAPVEHALAA